MKKTAKLTRTAMLLLCAGILMFAVAFAVNDFSFDLKEGSEEMQDRIQARIDEPFTSIEIDESSADVRVLISEDDSCVFSYTNAPGVAFKFRVDRGTLKISSTRDWTKTLFSSPDIVLELRVPGKLYNKIDIELSSGDMHIQGLQAKEMELEASSGGIFTEGIEADELSADTSSGSIQLLRGSFDIGAELEASSGDIRIEDVTAGKLEIDTSSGSITLARVDAQNTSIHSSSGDVSGSFSSPKNFEIKTSSGDVRAPLSEKDAAPCRIRTSSGDILISVEN